MKQVLVWNSWWVWLTFPLGLVIVYIVALIARRRAVVFIGVCYHHRSRRLTHITVSFFVVFLSFVLFVAGAIAVNSATAGMLLVAGFVTFISGTLYAIFIVPLVKAKRIDRAYVWMKGCHPDYLASFPEFEG